MIYLISNNQVINSSKVATISGFSLLHSWLEKHTVFALDTETTGLNPRTDKILTMQIGDTDTQFIIDLRGGSTNISGLRYYLESLKYIKIGANIAFDYKMINHQYNIRLENVYDVSRVDEIIYNGLYSELHKQPEQHKKLYAKAFSLKGVYKRHFGTDISKETRKGFINRSEIKPFTTEEIEYMANDCKYPCEIAYKQSFLIEKYKLSNCIKLENEVTLAIADMEYNGLGIDPEPWKVIANDLSNQLDAVFLELDDIVLTEYKLKEYKLLGIQGSLFDEKITPRRTYINWESSDQVKRVLNKCGFPVTDTEKKNLLPYKKGNIIVPALLRCRELSKSVSTYGYNFLKNIDSNTKRIHPSFWQLFTDTGRLSCRKPNLQNIKRGSAFRDCFIPRPGYKLITADYSNQELRLVAEASQDDLWIQAFRDNIDLHGLLAKKTFKITDEDLNKQFPFSPNEVTYRHTQKTVDFMLIYGGSAHKLSDTIGVSKEEAEKIIKQFFVVVPNVKKYLENSAKFGVTHGYCLTFSPINRIRWFKNFNKLKTLDFKARNRLIGEIERQSMNTPIQGTASDIVKTAMVKIRHFIRTNKLWDILILNLQVHDELVLECKDVYAEIYKKKIEEIMVDAGKDFVKTIPMPVSISLGNKWAK